MALPIHTYFKSLFWPDQRRSSTQGTGRAAFEQILLFAREIEQDPEALHSLIQALGRERQWTHLMATIKQPCHGAPAIITMRNLFFPESDQDLATLPEMACEQTVRLGEDLVLASPWHRERLLYLMQTIGTPTHPWKQDDNHRLVVLHPTRIALVRGGNHSIATGILKGTGQIHTEMAIDLRPALEKLECDGESFIDLATGCRIAPVTDVNFAAIFEIAKML